MSLPEFSPGTSQKNMENSWIMEEPEDLDEEDSSEEKKKSSR